MYSFEWMIGVALVALAGGLGLGALLGRSMGDSRKVQTLQEELEAAQQTHSNYRSEVYDQFAETARKFERMNESYSDLHQQLASSAALLLGDAVGTPLLSGPRSAAVIDGEAGTAESANADQASQAAEESGEIRSAMGASIDPIPEPAAAAVTGVAAPATGSAGDDGETTASSESAADSEPPAAATSQLKA